MTDTEGKKVVLVVDDAPANLQIVRSILNEHPIRAIGGSGCLASFQWCWRF